MAEHNGGDRRNDRGPFRGNNNSGGEPRGFRARSNRDGADSAGRPERDGKPSGERERKPFGDRPRRDEGERRSFGGGERKPFGDRDRKPFGDRPRREGEGDRRGGFGGGERKPFGDRDRKPFGDRPRRDEGERRSFGGGERKPYGDREDRSFGDRPRRDEGERRSFGGGGERKPFGDRDRKPFGDRPRREDGDRRSFGAGDNRKPFGDRQDRGPRNFDRSSDRSQDRGFNRSPARDTEGRDGRDNRFSRDDNRQSGPRSFGHDRQEDRPARVPNVRDLRSANRPDRERSPEIDEDVTGKELDRATQHQIKTLEAKSAEWVARHLVMAGRLIDDEPELAFQHALAASRRGGRLAAVREAVGLTAYAAGHYGEALREFRTYRRISGSNVHLPVMADCERGLGRPDRALDVARSEEAQDLDAPGKVELAIVAAGARTDLGQLDAAVAELEIQQLDINRAFSYSPRLFRAYSDALAAVGREAEAEKWKKQAVVAENALGQGLDEEPDIIDLGWDEEEEAREEAERRRLLAGASKPQDSQAQDSAAAEGTDDVGSPVSAEASRADSPADVQDANIDDAEADYYVSDDAESDQDSADEDEDHTEEEAAEGLEGVEDHGDAPNADRNED